MLAPCRVLLVDDHPVVREGLRALLATAPDLLVIGDATDGEEAVRLAGALAPDMIVMDLVLPALDGLAAIAAIRARFPHVRVLVLTGFCDDEKVLGALRLGVAGYMLKDAAPAEVLRAILAVAHGDASLHPSVARRLIREMCHSGEAPPDEALTEREVEVLRHVAHGLSNQEIADTCGISERTVRTHVSSILAKLRLSSRTQAALYALRQGIAHLEDG